MTVSLISCLVSTYNRRGQLPCAIRTFRRQTLPNNESVIFDVGDEYIPDLCAPERAIRHILLIRWRKAFREAARDEYLRAWKVTECRTAIVANLSPDALASRPPGKAPRHA